MAVTLQNISDTVDAIVTGFAALVPDIQKLIDDYKAQLGVNVNQPLLDSIQAKLTNLQTTITDETNTVVADDPGPVA